MFKFNFLSKDKHGDVIAAPKEALEAVKAGLPYTKVFTCSRCKTEIPNKLTMHSETPREEGESNFEGFHDVASVESYGVSPSLVGHSVLLSKHLNWAGLAEERSWKFDTDGKVICPPCYYGVTTEEYRRRREAGLL